jgi:hypothetical protein
MRAYSQAGTANHRLSRRRSGGLRAGPGGERRRETNLDFGMSTQFEASHFANYS